MYTTSGTSSSRNASSSAESGVCPNSLAQGFESFFFRFDIEPSVWMMMSLFVADAPDLDPPEFRPHADPSRDTIGRKDINLATPEDPRTQRRENDYHSACKIEPWWMLC